MLFLHLFVFEGLYLLIFNVKKYLNLFYSFLNTSCIFTFDKTVYPFFLLFLYSFICCLVYVLFIVHCIYIYTSIYKPKHIYADLHIHTSAHMLIFVHAPTHASIYAQIHSAMYLCIFAFGMVAIRKRLHRQHQQRQIMRKLIFKTK